MIISIVNQKGGTGKTTLAINIAREYTLRKIDTLVVDSDSQGSALRWHEKSNGNLIDLTCLPVTTLDKDVLKFRNRYQRIIIDGVPQMSQLTVCAIAAANLIFIPVQPSPYDIWATKELVDLVKHRIEITDGRTKAAFIISRKIKGTNLAKEIIQELEKYELPIFKSSTTQRVAYPTVAQHGSTVVDAHESTIEARIEIQDIVNEIEGF
jgi:chromosome partitioning protein